MTFKVLVTDGHSRAALQLVRSFGKLGFEVHVAEKTSLIPSFFSKYAHKSFVYPDPNDELNFVNSIKSYCDNNGIDQIYPVVDECLFALVKNRSLFEGIEIPFTNVDNLIMFRDKSLTIKQCEKLKLPHPKTFLSDNPNFEKISKELDFPIILKPKVGSGSRGIELVTNLEDLPSKFLKVKKQYGSPLIQEFIPNGGACGTEVLLKKGKPLAIFSHFRIREYPISGGPSTYRRPLKSKILEKFAVKLLSSVNWDGPAMVEFRIDKRTGVPKIMEVNGRYWGSLACSISSGVDFPKLHYYYSIGKSFKKPEYDLHTRSRWEVGDLLWLFSKGGYLVNYLSEFFSNITHDSFDYLKRDDPFPFLISFIEAASIAMTKGGRKYSVSRGWELDG